MEKVDHGLENLVNLIKNLLSDLFRDVLPVLRILHIGTDAFQA